MKIQFEYEKAPENVNTSNMYVPNEYKKSGVFMLNDGITKWLLFVNLEKTIVWAIDYNSISNILIVDKKEDEHIINKNLGIDNELFLKTIAIITNNSKYKEL